MSSKGIQTPESELHVPLDNLKPSRILGGAGWDWAILCMLDQSYSSFRPGLIGVHKREEKKDMLDDVLLDWTAYLVIISAK